MKYHVYTDGGCDPNPGFGSYSYIALSEGHTEVIERFVDSEKETTNNRMEMKAIIAAFEFFESVGCDDGTIYSDSSLCVNIYNSWMQKWFSSKDQCKLKNKKNLDLVHLFYENKMRFPGVKLKWIKGHSGHKWNNEADRLCSEEIERYYQSLEF